MNTVKIYNQFADKFGNQYSFSEYSDFAAFWFSLSRKAAKLHFPKNFDELQNCAANSKTAKSRLKI